MVDLREEDEGFFERLSGMFSLEETSEVRELMREGCRIVPVGRIGIGGVPVGTLLLFFFSVAVIVVLVVVIVVVCVVFVAIIGHERKQLFE